jgi:hypothetical protein
MKIKQMPPKKAGIKIKTLTLASNGKRKMRFTWVS